MEKITFSATVSDFVRSESVFRFGQNVQTETGMHGKFLGSHKIGKIKWYSFDFGGNRVEMRMMRFPYLTPMNVSREFGDTIGHLSLKSNLLVTINRKMARLLK
jgi:hypothetical protein